MRRAISLYKHSGAHKYMLCVEVSEYSADKLAGLEQQTGVNSESFLLFQVEIMQVSPFVTDQGTI